ncbi:hypothetical protein [Glycomyces sp. MUSA5-2]|uniref:hypothetical protein n=1 Tax=Glycomyces sp. MUSA5-2 TaxID=2053002 RepID=UPI00300B8B40
MTTTMPPAAAGTTADHISAAIAALPEPERDILLRHGLHPDPPPLARLARQHGMQRQQLHNLEARARKHLASACQTPALHELYAAAAQIITDVVPLQRVLDRVPQLRAEAEGVPLWRVLACAMRRWWTEDEWIAPQPVARAAAQCAIAVTALLDEHGAAPQWVVEDDLPRSLTPAEAQRWLAYCGGFTVRSEYVLAPSTTIADRAAHHLVLAGTPRDFEEVYQHVGAGSSRMSVYQALITDPRLIRCAAHTWALAAWDIKPARGIKDLIGNELDAAGTPLPVHEVVAAVLSQHPVTAPSVHSAASKPPFTIVDGHVTWLHPAADQRKEAR